MFHFTNSGHSFAGIGARYELSGAFLVLAVTACTGAITAINFGDSAILVGSGLDDAEASVLRTAFAALSFHVVAFMLGSSYFGFCLLPILSAAFGFFLYLQGARTLEVISFGFFRELLGVLLPVLLLVPCFFVIASEAFAASRQLYSLVSRHDLPSDRGRSLHFVLCVPFLALAALIFLFFCGR